MRETIAKARRRLIGTKPKAAPPGKEPFPFGRDDTGRAVEKQRILPDPHGRLFSSFY